MDVVAPENWSRLEQRRDGRRGGVAAALIADLIMGRVEMDMDVVQEHAGQVQHDWSTGGDDVLPSDTA